MNTRRSLVLAASAVLASGALGACGGSATRAGSAAATAVPPATSAPTSAPGSTAGSAGSQSPGPVATAHTSLGEVLVNGRGMTLYTLSSDSPGHSACTGGCLQVWPPLLLAPPGTSLTAPAGVTGLGRLSRPEGTQITWNGRPLYTYVGDTSAGSTAGQGIQSFGGVWKAAVVAGGSGAAAGASTSTTRAGSYPGY